MPCPSTTTHVGPTHMGCTQPPLLINPMLLIPSRGILPCILTAHLRDTVFNVGGSALSPTCPLNVMTALSILLFM